MVWSFLWYVYLTDDILQTVENNQDFMLILCRICQKMQGSTSWTQANIFIVVIMGHNSLEIDFIIQIQHFT